VVGVARLRVLRAGGLLGCPRFYTPLADATEIVVTEARENDVPSNLTHVHAR
jgi:hypothetical protein